MISAPEKIFRILLAEDDEDDYFFLKEDLLKYCVSCEVVRVANGEEAMQYLSSNTPDAIFLDNHMPRKEGIEVLADIRRDDRLKGIQVLILTGSQREDDRLKRFHLAAAVRKPIEANLESFRQACRQLEMSILK